MTLAWPPRKPFEIAFYVAVGLLLLHGLNSIGAHPEPAVTHNNIALLKLGKRWQETIDSLNREEAKAAALLVQIHQKDAQYRAALRLDSAGLRDASSLADTATVLAKTVSDQRAVIAACDTAGQAMGLEVLNCGIRANLLQARLDSVTAGLRAQVRVAECKIAFFTCPSRRTSAVLAVAIYEAVRTYFGHP